MQIISNKYSRSRFLIDSNLCQLLVTNSSFSPIYFTESDKTKSHVTAFISSKARGVLFLCTKWAASLTKYNLSSSIIFQISLSGFHHLTFLIKIFLVTSAKTFQFLASNLFGWLRQLCVAQKYLSFRCTYKLLETPWKLHENCSCQFTKSCSVRW